MFAYLLSDTLPMQCQPRFWSTCRLKTWQCERVRRWHSSATSQESRCLPWSGTVTWLTRKGWKDRVSSAQALIVRPSFLFCMHSRRVLICICTYLWPASESLRRIANSDPKCAHDSGRATLNRMQITWTGLKKKVRKDYFFISKGRTTGSPELIHNQCCVQNNSTNSCLMLTDILTKDNRSY